jgi:hypothetical protein
MDVELWDAYKKANDLGIKADAKRFVLAFIESCDDTSDMREWVYAELQNLPSLYPRMRHEVFEALVYPILTKDMSQEDPWAFFWMGQLAQNFMSNKKLYAASKYQGSTYYFERAYELCPAEDKFRLGLLSDILSWFDYIEHEWPAGILVAKDDVPKLLLDIAKARELDKEQNSLARLDRLTHRINQNTTWGG